MSAALASSDGFPAAACCSRLQWRRIILQLAASKSPQQTQRQHRGGFPTETLPITICEEDVPSLKVGRMSVISMHVPHGSRVGKLGSIPFLSARMQVGAELDWMPHACFIILHASLFFMLHCSSWRWQIEGGSCYRFSAAASAGDESPTQASDAAEDVQHASNVRLISVEVHPAILPISKLHPKRVCPACDDIDFFSGASWGSSV